MIEGIIKGFFGAIGVFLAILLLSIWGVDLSRNPTDPPDGAKSSGLTLHTDAETGCQYLSRMGGLTPRMDKAGRHMCAGMSDR